uniref:Uncharacterized protein n=1 Tax=Nelumbo nucifera TaxID=4432 RepID=A0A822XGF2_NELNU|nr:TPA_asm: hypothetical protein HUJ06_019550 [Nelumbo nucifera]DAD18089.1 TPA_asm: hypothetical protein HUJ06_019552 [Nelumbo nucifera]
MAEDTVGSDASVRRRGRGPTRATDIWNLPSREKIPITLNELGQGIGENTKKLVKFMGTIARNGDLCPLGFKQWTSFPTPRKDIWNLVLGKFEIDNKGRKWVLSSIGKKMERLQVKLESHVV